MFHKDLLRPIKTLGVGVIAPTFSHFLAGRNGTMKSSTKTAVLLINIYEQYHHGVDESLSESGLVVYPNPTNGILFVEHGQGEYQIVNLMGQTVMSGTLNGQPIDISRLSNGFYLLKCNYLSIKFVVNQ